MRAKGRRRVSPGRLIHMRKLYLEKNLQFIFGVTLMAVLGVSSIIPALPDIMEGLAFTPATIGLTIAVFTLPGVLLAPVVGILADRLGRKVILVPSLFLFGGFGFACFFAQSITQLLVLRFLQGVGAAPLGVLYGTMIGDLFEGRERGTGHGGLQLLGPVHGHGGLPGSGRLPGPARLELAVPPAPARHSAGPGHLHGHGHPGTPDHG